MSFDLKYNEASFLSNSIDSLCLRVAQVPRSSSRYGDITCMLTIQPITLPPTCICIENSWGGGGGGGGGRSQATPCV